MPIQIFLQPKTRKFSDKKKSNIFHISAQNIDCGYSLEPPLREVRKIMYTPVNPSWNYLWNTVEQIHTYEKNS